jgi:hypothetical protein
LDSSFPSCLRHARPGRPYVDGNSSPWHLAPLCAGVSFGAKRPAQSVPCVPAPAKAPGAKSKSHRTHCWTGTARSSSATKATA